MLFLRLKNKLRSYHMNNVRKKIWSLALLNAWTFIINASAPTPALGPVIPYYAIRSQGYDAARELAG